MLRELITTYRERVPSIRYTEHLEGSGEQVLRAACEHAVEGIIAKRADSPYVQKRTKYWVKKKCINRQEFVVGGFTEPKGTRSLFGSLVLGYYDASRRLVYCGNVGTGFNERSIRMIYDRLKLLEQPQSPFAGRHRRCQEQAGPLGVAPCSWPRWNSRTGPKEAISAILPLWDSARISSPEEIIREQAAPVESVPAGDEDQAPRVIPIKLSNPDKVLYPAEGVTKKQLAEYYLRVGQHMLPEVVNRPLVLVRCPEGLSPDIRQKCFFQKHLREDIPEWVRTVPIEEKGQTSLYPVLDDLNGVLSLVQLGVLEIHMLGCRADAVDRPDRMIFDLDPAPDVPPGRLLEATFYIKEWLAGNKMRPLLKLTGGKGIHIVVPLSPVLNWEELKKLSKAIATEMVRIRPQWFVATVTKSKRTGKILVDYLRNSLGASTIVPYSTRALPGAPVAFPVSEEDLTEFLLTNPITVRNSALRLRQLKQVPWEGVR